MAFIVFVYLLISICLAIPAISGSKQQCADISPIHTATAETQAYLSKFDSFQITYFNGRGLAEIPRTIFATVGKFPGHGFENVLLTRDEFNQRKGSGDLAKNLNRVPILNHNGNVVGQSNSIARYLSNNFGLLGTNAAEASQIDSMCEHVVDIKAAFRKVFPYGKKLTNEERAEAELIWFNTPSMPALEGRAERQLHWFLEQVEGFLPGDGFAVGGRPSMADAYFFNLLGEHAAELPEAKGAPFGNLEATKKVLQQFPKLRGVVKAFRQSPGMTYYLANRHPMEF